ncbi:hypothetical protein [Paractinoplanes rishiriensis]|uniref:Uncharacterized protein n=1 Tax=Paractinoplanes rishiriensis TaxID=1050105 RepID=A0A919K673_9ACTN|nr:hypothetical protein [Actinoplanes rishiriensis]GIF01672.1 hypothetical protein Ari01nite_91360 [Actinoplanes rishiriensis]
MRAWKASLWFAAGIAGCAVVFTGSGPAAANDAGRAAGGNASRVAAANGLPAGHMQQPAKVVYVSKPCCNRMPPRNGVQMAVPAGKGMPGRGGIQMAVPSRSYR